MEKVKLQQLIQKVSKQALKEAIAVAKPKYKGKSDTELAEIFGLTEYQFNHLFEKALADSIHEKLLGEIEKTFQAGQSLEVPHQFNVFVHQSKARVNDQGNPSRKLSIRTRRSLKAVLNK